MILIDTSIWIDHLHSSDALLVDVLERDEAGSHPAVIEELALGSMRSRDDVLEAVGNLFRFPVLRHEEMMVMISGRRLWGRGLSAVDCHLLGSVALVDGAQLFTRDKRLLRTCEEMGISCTDGRF